MLPVFLITVGFLCIFHNAADASKFVFEGTNWEEFTGIPDFVDKITLEHFELKRAKFNSDLLLHSLEECPQLKSIKLSNVRWSGEFRRRINLPYIKSYILELPISKTCQLNSSTELIALLFFLPIFDGFWKLDTSFELIDISCLTVREHVGGFMDEKRRPVEKILRISSGQELVVKNVRFDVTQYLTNQDFLKVKLSKTYLNTTFLNKLQPFLFYLEIEDLENLTDRYDLKRLINVAQSIKYLDLKLSISNLNFDLDDLNPQSIKNLKIFNENHGLRILGKFSFPKLTQLELGSSGYPTWVDSTIAAPKLRILILTNALLRGNGTVFLGKFHALRYFKVSKMDIEISSLPATNLRRLEFVSNVKINQLVPVKFPKIKSLKFDSSCDFEESVLESFSTTFKSTRSVIITGTESEVSPKLALQVLQTYATYFVFRFNRHSTNYTEDEIKLKQLLRKFGVPEDYSVNSIILTRESKRSDWSWSYSQKFTKMDSFLYFFYPISIGIVSVFGIIGNIFNAVILFRKQMQSSTTNILLCLTLCDFIMLWTSLNLIPYSLSNSFRYRLHLPPHVFPADLKMKHLEEFLFYPLRKTAYTGSVYTTVLITFERFIAVSFPLQAKRFITIKKSKIYCATLLLAATIFNLPRWFESYSIKDENQALGHMSSVTLFSSRKYRKYYHGWTWTLVIFAIPVLLIASFNLTIYWKVRDATKRRLKMISGGRNPNPSSGVDMSLTRMLICVVLVFVILNLIHGGIVLYHTLFQFYVVSLYWDKEKDMSEIEVVACLPVLLNSSVNFIIYCALGKQFREEFLKLIPKWIRLRCSKTG